MATEGMMPRSALAAIAFAVLLVTFPTPVRADERPSLYGGGFLERSTLTGDWRGLRDDLAAKGVTLDASLTQITQGVVSGGKDGTWEYGGRGNLTLHLDTQKLGLWPGGFLTLEVEGNFARGVNRETGGLLPVNSNQLYPRPFAPHFNVPQLSFAQFLSPYAGIVLGKLDTTSGDANEFAHGKGDTQFFNLAFNLNPTLVLTAPYSTLGAGVIVLPTADPAAAIVQCSVLQANGSASEPGFDDLAGDKLTFAGEGRVRTAFFGLTGHQLAGGTYSNREYTSLDQRLGLPFRDAALATEDDSWSLYYNFDQYLYEPERGSGEGVGVFARFGASDGNPNPMEYFYSAGFGGKGAIPGRPNDRYGIGYYYIDIRRPTFQVLRFSRSFLRDEWGFEAFYNFALTPWLELTPDLQVIGPAQKQTRTLAFPRIVRERVDPAVVLGFRLRIVF
jgi:porin